MKFIKKLDTNDTIAKIRKPPGQPVTEEMQLINAFQTVKHFLQRYFFVPLSIINQKNHLVTTNINSHLPHPQRCK